MRRGRPRHDDVLTPREWQVLDLVRAGLTNEQIAARLGISHDTAKFHVSEILTKLGVTTRREAAAWRGKPKVAFGFAPVTAVLHKLGAVSPWKLAGGGAIAAAGAGFMALAIGLLISRSNQQWPSEPAVAVPVAWVEEDLPDPVSWETNDPFEDVLAPGEDDVWRVYVVRDGGRPHLLTETNRYLEYGIDWHRDEEVVLHFVSRKESSSGRILGPIRGLLALDPATGDVRWERITDTNHAQISPDGERFIVNTFPQHIYVADIGRSAMKLEGLQGGIYAFAGPWSPDNRRFIVLGYEDDGSIDPMDRYAYVVSPGDTEAIKIDARRGDAYVLPRWSPDGKQLVYPDGHEMVVVDAADATLRRFPITNPADEVPLSVLIWSDDGRYVLYGGGLFDTRSGEVVQPVSPAIYTRISPDSRYFVASSDMDTGEGFGLPACPEVSPGRHSNRTRIYDLQTGDELDVLACGEVPYAPWRWLDDEHILMTGATCADCPSKQDRAVILDVTDGSTTQVQPHPETDAWQDFSAGGRFFRAGEGLTVFGRDGLVQATHASPDGYPIRSARWSPDGSAIVFTTGPEVDLEPLWQIYP